jgi:hypothetical protein
MYKLLAGNFVKRLTDGAVIPLPPAEPEGYKYQAWLDAGNTPEPADPEPTPDYSAKRSQAYRNESDPLFFKSQRGEATHQDWLDKVAEIRTRWPANL